MNTAPEHPVALIENLMYTHLYNTVLQMQQSVGCSLEHHPVQVFIYIQYMTYFGHNKV